jgi:hypothetical protein
MGRKPPPTGSWGLIRTELVGHDERRKPKRHRARAYYRDFDGLTRLVEASGRSASQASQNVRAKLQNRTMAGRHGELTAMTRFADAADLWLTKVDGMVAEGRRSPGTVETYRRQLKNHVLPALGEVRLGGGHHTAGRQGGRRDQRRRQRRDGKELPQRDLGCDEPPRPVRRRVEQPGS